MSVLVITRIGRYSRTGVPREVRKILELGESDGIGWIFGEGRVIIRKRGEVCG